MTLDRRLLIVLLVIGALLFIVSGALAGVLIAGREEEEAEEEGTGKGYLGVRVTAAAGGLRIVSVDARSPAAEAGLKAGDVIRAVDGQVVRTPEALRRIIEAKAPGTRVTVTYERGDREQQAVVVLGEAPADAQLEAEPTPQAELPEGLPPQLRDLLRRQLERGQTTPEELAETLRRFARENVRVGRVVEISATSLTITPITGGEPVTVGLTEKTTFSRAYQPIQATDIRPGEIVLVFSMDGGRTAFAVYAYGP